ncbi:MAG TPA: TldD/PmbA family protein [Chloroflexia bacterium]|nr:TldD/PmbA family protein [Chloroflexia bacterium]
MIRERITDALKKSKADYTEIRVETKDTTSVAYRGKILETVNTGRDVGGLVRVLHNGNWGVSSFNSLDELDRHVALALECARALGEGDAKMAEVAPHVYEMSAQMENDFRKVDLSTKKDLTEHYKDIMVSSPGLQDSSVGYSDSLLTMYYANSEGAYIKQERPYSTLRFSATARDGSNVQTAFDSVQLAWDFNNIYNQEEKVADVAKRAVEMLKAEPVKAGNYTVVLNQKLAGVFIHEAFGHLSEADHIDQNPRAQEMMRLGRRFGPSILNVSDGGVHPNLYGTLQFDDEGTPAQETDLVKNGELVGRLHSRETAAKLGEKPTGNARATDYRYPPIVRMTNTCIKPGETSFEDMIKDIELGIYAVDAIGGQTEMENFSFSSQYGYMIRNGQLAEMVKDVILAGNLFTTLSNIEAVGNDMEWAAGGCGKGQGGPLPVGTGAPHVRIKNVLVGGQASKSSAFQV